MPRSHRLLGSHFECNLLAFDRVHRCDVDEVVHAARRYLDLFPFDAEHAADVFAVRTLHFHVLFDLQGIDHGDYLMP